MRRKEKRETYKVSTADWMGRLDDLHDGLVLVDLREEVLVFLLETGHGSNNQ